MEFVKVTFSVQVATDVHGDEKTMANLLQTFEHAAEVEGGQFIIENVTRIQLPEIKLADF